MVKIWRILPMLVFIGLAFFLWRGLSLDPKQLPSTQIGQAVPDFVLQPVASQNPQAILHSQTLRGHYFLINVWASWCAACEAEQPFLLNLAQQGIVIYGLNYKDSPKHARDWLAVLGNPFQGLIEDKRGQIAMDLGVYGAPETFLVDSQGIIQFRHAGVLDEKTWRRDFLPRIHHVTSGIPALGVRYSHGLSARQLLQTCMNPSLGLLDAISGVPRFAKAVWPPARAIKILERGANW